MNGPFHRERAQAAKYLFKFTYCKGKIVRVRMAKCGEGVMKVYLHSFLTSALSDVSSGYFSQARSWRCQLNKRLIGPQNQSGGFDDEMKSLTTSGIRNAVSLM
jgi:hypothetical protein